MVADFTELAEPQEHYHELCSRLFGNTLEPVRLKPEDIDIEIYEIEEVIAEEDRKDIVVEKKETGVRS